MSGYGLKPRCVKAMFENSDEVIRLLVVEDYDEHFDSLVFNLSFSSSEFQIERAVDLQTAFNLLTDKRFDLILLDLNLPDSAADSTLERMVAFEAATPIIVLTSISDEIFGQELIKEGAQDYISKQELSHGNLLVRAIKYSLERYRRLRQLKALNERLEKINDDLEDFVFLVKGEMQDTMQSIRTYCNYSSVRNKNVLFSSGSQDEGLEEWFQQNLYQSKHSLGTLNQLTDELLVYARMSPAVYQRAVAISLDAVFREVVESLERTAVSGVPLRLGQVDQFPQILFYLPLVRRTVRSLLNLVVAFGHSDGEVSLKQMPGREGVVTVQLSLERDLMVKSSRREGMLMFRQLFTYSTAISLSIVQSGLDNFGCRLWIETSMHRGLAVFFELPEKVESNVHEVKRVVG